YSADGRTLAVGCLDTTVSLWETATGRVQQTLSHGDVVTSVVFAPDGRQLATANNGTHRRHGQAGAPRDRDKVRVWDVAAGKEVRRLAGHRGGVFGLCFAADGRYLASASSDTTVLLWDARTWPAFAPVQLSPDELKAAWADLDGADAARAFRAIGKLAASP